MAHLPAATVRPELLLLAAPALAPGADHVAEGAVVDVAVAPSVVVSVAGVVLALSVFMLIYRFILDTVMKTEECASVKMQYCSNASMLACKTPGTTARRGWTS